MDLSDSARLGIVALYPNPSQALTEVHFNYTENYVPTELVVYDEAGNIVQRRSIADPDSGKQELDVSSLSNGVYFVTLINSGYYARAIELVVYK